MTFYPERHHPVFFLEDALRALGADVEFNHRDERTLGCWGLIVNGKPMVWLIDNRHEHERVTEDPAAKELLARGALVCHAQKPDMERVGGKWLPLAATPGYRPMNREKLYDAAFVGYVRDAGRATLLADIASRYTLSVNAGLFGDHAVEAYNMARCGVNIPTGYGQADAYDSANMRFFEVMACGIPLVTPFENYLYDLGVIANIDYVAYHAPGDLLDAVSYALQHPEIGDTGRRLVESRHTYAHRAQQVLEWLS